MEPDAEPSTFIIKLIILIAMLAISAFFSSAETAFISADRFAIRQLIQDGNKRAKKVAKILEDKDAMISAILIGNNIVNIFASSLTTTMVYEAYGNEYVSIATGILTIAVLLWGEIMPKTIAGQHAEKVAMIYAPILYVFIKFMTPAIWIVNLISAFFMRMFGIKTKATDTVVTEDVLKTMLDMSLEDDQIVQEEHEIMQNILESTDLSAKDIMVPRSNVVCITEDSTYEDIISVFKTYKYSRLVVFNNDKNKVLGILHMKDILFVNQDEFDVHNFLRQPYFTFETKSIQYLLTEMRKTSSSMAIVLDEYGELIGVLTIEDIIEEFVGQIRDEYDDDELKEIKKVDNGVYEVAGALNISDINNALDIALQSENYNSVGGFIIERLEEFPKDGDVVSDGAVKLEVVSVVDNKIETVRVILG